MSKSNSKLRLIGRTIAIGLVLIGQLPLIVNGQRTAPTAGQQILATGQEPTGPGSQQKAAPLTGGMQDYHARLDTDLFVADPIQLRGVAAGATINFVRPREWTIQSGTEVRIQLSHSENLIPDLSYLTVTVNSTNLKTIQLNHENVLTTLITVPIPPEILQDYNKLQFSLSQHYTRDCEDPFHASLWTRINKESEIYFVYKPTPPKPDLAIWPAPFYDDLHYGPVELQYLPPQPTTSQAQSLKAMAMVNTALAQDAAWHPMETTFVNSVGEAKYPLIIVGTPSEQPAIKDLTAGKSIAGPYVQVTQSPSNPLIPILIVTGTTGAEVVKAAQALTTSSRNALLNSDSASLSSVTEGKKSDSHDWPHYIPNKDQFTLADMGYSNQSVHGFFSTPIIMDFKSVPDYKYHDRDQQVKIHFQYTGNLNRDMSTMEVRVDDIVVRSYALDNKSGEQRWETFEMPSGLINPNSKLSVRFHMYPIGYDPCRRVEDEQLNATLYSDTTFALAKDNVIKLPDLEAFRNGGFPFTEFQDMQNLAIVLPQQPSANDIQMMMNVTTRLGRMSRSERIAFDVVLGIPKDDVKNDNNLIVIGTPERQKLIAEISNAKKSVFSLSGDKKTLVGLENNPELTSNVNADQGYIEEMISPWGHTFSYFENKDAKHVILVLTGRNEQAMMLTGRVLIDDKLFSGDRINNKDLRGLEGNLILVESNGHFNVQRTPDVFRSTDIARVPWYRDIQLTLSNYWVTFLIVTIIVLFLAFIVFRAALVRYRYKHSGQERLRFS